MSSGLAWRLQTSGQGASTERHYKIELWEMEDPASFLKLFSCECLNFMEVQYHLCPICQRLVQIQEVTCCYLTVTIQLF